jgi:MFS transporter, putative metabolite:H+ symporter
MMPGTFHSHRNSASAGQLLARLDNVPFTRWHMKARVVMGSATFFDAFGALSLAFALPVLNGLWHISLRQSGLLIGATYVGQLAGAILFSWIAERFGRVRSASIAVGIIAVMSLACALAQNFGALMACRMIQGIGIGGEMPVAAAYISELSPARRRGRFFLLYEMIFPIGLMAAGQAGAWLVPLWGWQSMFLMGGIPCLVICVLLARLPESPRWLISQGRLGEAEAIVRQVEASAGQVSGSADEVLFDARKTRWREVVSSAYRGRTFVVWALWFCAYFVSNTLNNWLPTLYNTVYRLPLKQALRAASLTNVTQVLLLLICAFCIDRLGRRKWTVACFIAGAVLLGTLGITGARGVLGVIIGCTLSYGILGSANAVLYLYTPEIYPTRMRVIGVGLATSWLRVASAVGPAIVGVMVAADGIGSVFLMFAGVSVAGALAAGGMIETRGQRLEELAP